MKTPVLMYHEITDRPAAEIPVDERPYAVRPKTFEQQLDCLAQQGVTSELISSGSPATHPTVVLTFDDGYASDAKVALPRLVEYGLKAEFYITTGWIGKPGYIDKSDIRALVAAGMIIGTHGVTHRYFDDLDEEELEHELLASKKTLEDIIGQAIVGGSAPGGRIHPKTRGIASGLGYQYLCVSDVGLADLALTDEFRYIPRLAIKRDMTLEQFSRLASGDRRTILLNRLKTKTLTVAKRAFGNRNYEKIRRRLLAGRKVR